MGPATRREPIALYDAARHESVLEQAWDPLQARNALDTITSDLLAGCTDDLSWPPHPDDSDEATPLTSLYHGSAGVVWALRYLASQNACAPLPESLTTLDSTERALQRNHRWLETEVGGGYDSYFLGDVPLMLMAYGQQPTLALAERLHATLGQEHDPTLEILWGRPGLILAAVLLHEHTGDAHWADLFRMQTQRLWDSLDADAETGIRIWLQDLYGERSRLVGAMHGFAGNVFPVIKGLHLLAPEQQAAWRELIVATTQATACVEGGLANWPPSLGTPRKGRDAWLVQHCHGAPGIVNSLADLADPRLDELLIQAGETIWQAGPLGKGSNLCHGTGGNGYAFLKLYRRSGNTRWLERARAYAMHGIAQTDARRTAIERGRYSLWTGDAGFAVYLWDCLREIPAMPTWDVFF